MFYRHHKKTVKGVFSEFDENQAFVARICACVTVLLMIFYNLFPMIKEDVLEPGECTWDYTFVISQGLNDELAKHPLLRDKMMMYSSFLLDLIQMIGIILFCTKCNSFRCVLAFIYFFPQRQIIQEIFLMGRPAGFLWHDPGIPSITVPYHDSSDFYYSGHVGTACLWLCEFWCHKWYIMVAICVLTATIEWLFLILIQTHYIIDLIAGMFIAHWCWLAAEQHCYYFDVKFFGFSRKERDLRTY
jgi:hypothetical protein